VAHGQFQQLRLHAKSVLYCYMFQQNTDFIHPL